MEIEIIPIGTKVKTVLDNIEGMVTAVFLRHGSIAYEISYFINGEYKSIVITELEFLVEGISKQRIGFKNGRN